MTFDDFKNRLAHSYVAYRYAVAGVPAAPLFARGPVHVGGFHFENEGHATSMLVELGWAFFVRLDAVLENFCCACGQGVAGDALKASMEASGKFSNHELKGLARYRDIRKFASPLRRPTGPKVQEPGRVAGQRAALVAERIAGLA